MKKLAFLLIGLGSLTLFSVAHATITNLDYTTDGDGAIYCPVYTWDGNPDVLNIDGYQYWGPAHIVGTIDTDTALDPTLTVASAVNNDTAFAWAAYYVNVYMSNTFTLSGVTVSNVPIGDWTATITQAPTAIGGGLYEASMQFQSGTPLPISGELDFAYTISFASSTHYSFTQEMIVVPVPEPGTFSLLAVGGMALAGWSAIRRRRNRSA